MRILKGAEISAEIKKQVQEILASVSGHAPMAAIVRVGEKPDDISYEKGAQKKLAAFGLTSQSYVFPETIPDEEFRREFAKINEDKAVDGILLLRPLPKQIDEKAVERMIRPEKDLDGISPINSAKVFAGEADGFAPCTAEAVIEVLKGAGIAIEGRRAVIVGRSMVVGRPLSMLLLKENATVTICHTRTRDLKAVCKKGDILIAAAGKAGMLTAEYVAEGAVVIDVGINVDADGHLCGDVKWDGLEDVASAATPVPGGVGGVTTAVLAKHLALAALRKQEKGSTAGA
jgi:methylenetetrahydrofolate dehydrogenase (NADP+)/methenyltetrahydrofolate cyclohydrolase